jgi:phage baseplate assembly protein W
MGISIGLPFSFTSGGGVYATSDERKQWQDIVVATIMTAPLERVMRPTFGSYAGTVLHENEDSAMVDAKSAVTSSFNTWIPSLKLLSVNCYMNYELLNDPAMVISVEYETPSKAQDSITVRVGTFNRSGELLEERN